MINGTCGEFDNEYADLFYPWWSAVYGLYTRREWLLLSR